MARGGEGVDGTGMKKLFLIGMALILLGGGAGGWWFFLRSPAAPAAPGEAVASSDQAPVYVPLPSIVVSVLRGERLVRHVKVDVALEVHGEANRAQLVAGLPRVLDAFVVELHELLRHRYVEEGGYDPALVKRRLKAAAARVIGPGLVADILVKGITRGR